MNLKELELSSMHMIKTGDTTYMLVVKSDPNNINSVKMVFRGNKDYIRKHVNALVKTLDLPTIRIPWKKMESPLHQPKWIF